MAVLLDLGVSGEECLLRVQVHAHALHDVERLVGFVLTRLPPHDVDRSLMFHLLRLGLDLSQYLLVLILRVVCIVIVIICVVVVVRLHC